MKKSLNNLTIAATVTVSLFASMALPAAVRKHGQKIKPQSTVLSSESTLTQKGISKTSPKGFAPAKTRSARKGVSSQFNHPRSIARMAAAKPKATDNTAIPQLNGIMIYSSSWGYNAKPGLYALPSATSDNFEMIVPEAYGSGIVKDDRLYVVSRIYFPDLELNYPRLTVYDMESKNEIFYENYSSSPDWSILPIDMDIDPVSGDIYGITYNSDFSGYQLSRLSFTDSSVTSECIASLDPSYNWNSMAFDATGNLYAISKENGVVGDYVLCVNSTLNKLDKNTGAITPIGETGLCPEYPTSAAIDKASGRMFWTVCPYEDVSYLAEVNLTTGAATILRTFDNAEEITSLYAVAKEAEANAPAKVNNLEAVFENGSLSGKINFTAPTTLYNGTAATGPLNYTILANDLQIAQGSTTFGGRVSANVTLPVEGRYKFVVRVSNDAGEGPAVSTSVTVGTGVPYATPYAFLKYADGKMNLTWTPVDAAIDGGYIDPTRVTYTVTRYPGETVVAEDIYATSFSESIPVPPSFVSYHYTVTTNYAGKSSEPTVSNSVGIGAIVPPYNETFDSEESLSGWTIIDVNADMRRWMWSTWENLRISFNNSMAMDDWAITPGLQLEAGAAYELSFDVYGDGGSETETIEVMMGASNNVESMTTRLVDPTDVTATKDEPLTIRTTITPTVSGVYYIGFHGMSAPDQYMLNLDNVKIASALNSGAPAAPADLSAVADPTGQLKATISFTAPDKSIAGGALWQAFSKVEILRDNEVVATLTNINPKEKVSYEDKPQKSGTYNYAARCYNMFGQGAMAYTSVYVGVNIPAQPENVAIVETSKEGEVTVSWSAVTTDINGQSIPASEVKYVIAEPVKDGWKPLFEDLTTTSHTFQATTTQQDMVQYAVFASTEGGVGEGTLTPMIPVGPAYPELHESFADTKVSNLWGTRPINNAQFGIYGDESGYTSQDGDNGFLGMVGEALEDSAAIFSGKISLANMDNPTLSFYTFNLANNNANIIKVGIKEAGAAEFTEVKSLQISEVCNPGQWGKVVIPLSAYKGKTIQFELTGVVKIYPYIFIDNINVANLPADDLAISSITAPETVAAGSDYTVSVVVANEGTAPASSYTVNLFANGIEIDSADAQNLASGSNATFTFPIHADPLSLKPIKYSASVVYSKDANLKNNESEEVTVTVEASTLPAPENLTISSENGEMLLSWNAPDLSKIDAVTTTEDVENAESFAFGMEGWKFVDVDGSPVGGIDGASGGTLNIPNVIGGVTPASFFIFDASLPQFGAALEAFSGTKYLAALFRADNGETDDWAISPELTGDPQRISFIAKSLSSSAEEAEHVQVLYSTGSTDPSDFIAVEDFRTVPSKWTRMSFNLPAGAKRFAIRSSSTASFMLMIDDITFTAAVNFDEYKVTGYNVYRESAKINDSAVASTSYNDPTGEADHTYVVTAIYDKKGESRASNATRLSSIESIVLKFKAYAQDGCIVISGAEDSDVVISSLNGIIVYSGNGDTKVSVAPGIYLVKVGKAIVKLQVN